MRRSEVCDEWAEDNGMDALADHDHRCYAAQGGTRRCANPVIEPDSPKIE